MECYRLFGAAVLLWAIPVFARGEPFDAKAGNAIRTDLFGDPLPKGAIARMGTVRFTSPFVHTLAWSPDGRTLASSDYVFGSIRLWDVASGKEIRRFAESKGDTVLAWSPDGKTLASGYDDDSTIHLWDVASGKEIRSLNQAGIDGIESLAWSPNGKILASGHDDNSIRLWDPTTGKKIRGFLSHTGSVKSVAWSADGKSLAAAGLDKTIRLFEAATGKEGRRLVGHADYLNSVAWSADGKTLVSYSEDKTARLWDVATGKESHRLAGVSSAACSPDGKLLALRYGEETRLCESATGRVMQTLSSKGLSSVVWSPDGTMLASRREDRIHLWEAATGKEIHPREGHENDVTSLCWSPDGKVVASGSCDKTIRLWDAATGKALRSLKGHGKPVCSLCWSPNGKMLASGSKSVPYCGASPEPRTIRLWDAATGEEIRPVAGHKGDVGALSWSPDGETLASGGDDQTIRIWNIETRKELERIASDADEIRILVWAPDRKALAWVGGDKILPVTNKGATIHLFAAATGKEIRRLAHEETVSSAAWSPDGRILASTGDGSITLWAAASGKAIRRFDAPGDALCWSPDGKTLATARFDTIHLWEAATGKEIRRLVGPKDHIQLLAWSPDGKRLASAGCDTTLLIWAIGPQRGDPPIRLTLSQLKSCWKDLAGEDAVKAYQAIDTLIRGAKESVPFLAERLKQVSPVDSKRVSRLIEELDSDRFALRQHASSELKQLAELAEAAMRQALENHPTLESRKRLEHLLADLDVLSGERLRALRAIVVLEHIATGEARRILQSLADGTATAQLTQDAKESLNRLTKRPAQASIATKSYGERANSSICR